MVPAIQAKKNMWDIPHLLICLLAPPTNWVLHPQVLIQ